MVNIQKPDHLESLEGKQSRQAAVTADEQPTRFEETLNTFCIQNTVLCQLTNVNIWPARAQLSTHQ
jgi:hypothetical protein